MVIYIKSRAAAFKTATLGLLSAAALVFFSCSGSPREEAPPPFERETFRSTYSEYRTGNMPFLLTAPHGGMTIDPNLPVRTVANSTPDPNSSFATIPDAYTKELTLLIEQEIFAATGKYPYVVFFDLHRSQVDANRNKIYAYPTGETASEVHFDQFHEYIRQAKAHLLARFGTGLMLDVHGHGLETYGYPELQVGYLLLNTHLSLDDAALNGSYYINRSSVKYLATRKAADMTFAELIRGEQSLGKLLLDAGFADVVPSPGKPKPTKANGQNNYHFYSGGYDLYNGSRDGGKLDAIQIEWHRSARNPPENARTAQRTAAAMLEYLRIHYGFTY